MRCLVAGHNGHRTSHRRPTPERSAPDAGPVPDTAGAAARTAAVRAAGRAKAHALRRQMSDQGLRTAADHRDTHPRPVHRARVQVHTQGTCPPAVRHERVIPGEMVGGGMSRRSAPVPYGARRVSCLSCNQPVKNAFIIFNKIE